MEIQFETNQVELADLLVNELIACGHEDIKVLDILDAMASHGLALYPDMDGKASQAYLLELQSFML